MDTLAWVFVSIAFIISLLSIILYFRRNEHYRVATDIESTNLFERVKNDLSLLYPHQLSAIDIKGLVSCIPEDSFTEDKQKVGICIRNPAGDFYPYGKILKIGIHELAHVMSKQHDPEHKTPEFISNYSYLMNKAYQLGLKVE